MDSIGPAWVSRNFLHPMGPRKLLTHISWDLSGVHWIYLWHYRFHVTKWNVRFLQTNWLSHIWCHFLNFHRVQEFFFMAHGCTAGELDSCCSPPDGTFSLWESTESEICENSHSSSTYKDSHRDRKAVWWWTIEISSGLVKNNQRWEQCKNSWIFLLGRNC